MRKKQYIELLKQTYPKLTDRPEKRDSRKIFVYSVVLFIALVAVFMAMWSNFTTPYLVIAALIIASSAVTFFIQPLFKPFAILNKEMLEFHSKILNPLFSELGLPLAYIADFDVETVKYNLKKSDLLYDYESYGVYNEVSMYDVDNSIKINYIKPDTRVLRVTFKGSLVTFPVDVRKELSITINKNLETYKGNTGHQGTNADPIDLSGKVLPNNFLFKTNDSRAALSIIEGPLSTYFKPSHHISDDNELSLHGMSVKNGICYVLVGEVGVDEHPRITFDLLNGGNTQDEFITQTLTDIHSMFSLKTMVADIKNAITSVEDDND